MIDCRLYRRQGPRAPVADFGDVETDDCLVVGAESLDFGVGRRHSGLRGRHRALLGIRLTLSQRARIRYYSGYYRSLRSNSGHIFSKLDSIKDVVNSGLGELPS